MEGQLKDIACVLSQHFLEVIIYKRYTEHSKHLYRVYTIVTVEKYTGLYLRLVVQGAAPLTSVRLAKEAEFRSTQHPPHTAMVGPDLRSVGGALMRWRHFFY